MKKLNKTTSFLSRCGISYDKKAKCFKMKKKKKTRLQAPKPQASSAMKQTQFKNRVKI